MSRIRDLLIKRRSEVTPLIHWDFSGKSNADASTIVEDLTGNGYDLELKNFAFDNVSGYNGYPIDFRKWDKAGSTYDGSVVSIYENKIVFDGIIGDTYKSTGIVLGRDKLPLLGSLETLLIKVSGLKENQQLRVINQTPVPTISTDIGNGISFVDIKNYNNPDAKYPAIYIVYYSELNNGDKTLNNVTVEIFPLYPDQLVFNGNKAVTVKPVKINKTRGFTVIVRRQFIQEDIRTTVLGQQGNTGTGSDFYVREYKHAAGSTWMVFNFNTANTVYSPTGNLTWSTLSKFFNGQVATINRPKVESPDDAPLMLGTYNYNSDGDGNFAVREVYVFDRDLTQSQIEKFISDNMIPLPEVYYDVAKQGTLNEHTTKDKLIDFSGNENHGTLHNFTFDETNGWGYDEDCLRFKATDHTYISLDTLTKGFKTIFMVFNPAAMGQIIYDQRTPEALSAGRNKFAIYGENNSIAWNARNTGGVTYINGELNTTKLSSSLIGQKHCATLVNNTIEDGDTTTPLIGKRTNSDATFYSDMKLYKFLGFKEALSEKQIKMVIEKYGLQVD